MHACESADVRQMLLPEELEKRAKKLAAFSISAATTGNTVSVFALLVLQEILEQQALNPTANLDNIIAIANSISLLNGSIKLIDP